MSLLIDQLSSLIKKARQQLGEINWSPVVTPATQEHFGHYQCNDSFRLASQLGKPPQQIAVELASAIAAQAKKDGLNLQLEIAPPAFINIILGKDTLNDKLNHLLKDPRLGLPSKDQQVIVEFSSPNIAKELHVGHLRSTIIGDCLARIFEALDYRISRINHLGDWGTPMGMLLTYIREREHEIDLNSSLLPHYQAARKEFDEDEQFRKRAQTQVVALQNYEPKSHSLWQKIAARSRSDYQKIYDLLDVKLNERGESSYQPILAQLLEQCSERGILTLSAGAKCIFLPEFLGRDGTPLPLILQKRDGGYTYAATDLAAMWQRGKEAERIIILTDVGQKLHLSMVAKAAEILGFLDKAHFQHICFGIVHMPSGQKMQTRSGESVSLSKLLAEGIAKAKEILSKRGMGEPQLSKSAEILGINAIKYADLRYHRLSNYRFDPDQILSFEGNTAAFVLYAYVRIASIERRLEREKLSNIDVQHPSEIALAFHLLRFPEVVRKAADELLPHRITDYLYALATKFNLFFRDCRVEGSQEQSSRLALCSLAKRIIAKGCDLLGLRLLEKM